MKETTAELVRLRLQAARETLNDAETMLRHGSLRSTMNRIYYAMFYATLALLATKNLKSPKHSGAIALFHREFVRPRIFPSELGKYLDRAFDLRIGGDYREYVVLKRDELGVLLEKARAFVSKAEEVIRASQ